MYQNCLFPFRFVSPGGTFQERGVSHVSESVCGGAGDPQHRRQEETEWEEQRLYINLKVLLRVRSFHLV